MNNQEILGHRPMIPSTHPIWTAAERDEIEINAWLELPAPLLRWFAADCAERACTWVGRCEGSSVRAILAGRLHAMGLISNEALNKAHMAASAAAERVSPKYPIGGPGSGLRWGACLVAKCASEKEASSAAYWASDWLSCSSSDSEEDYIWQFSRLRYLCDVWNKCGERALPLLWDCTCHVECPKDARL